MTTILAMTVSAAESIPPPVSPPREAEETPIYKSCADDSYSYYEATEDCNGYIYCIMGTPNKRHYCRDVMMYLDIGAIEMIR